MVCCGGSPVRRWWQNKRPHLTTRAWNEDSVLVLEVCNAGRVLRANFQPLRTTRDGWMDRKGVRE